MSQHRSVWLADAEPAQFAPLDGDRIGDDDAFDVVVAGGGLTGLTTALLLQREGARVALVEAGRLAYGTSGRTTGKVTVQQGLVYDQLRRDHGDERAQAYAAANDEGIDLVARLATETGGAAALRRLPAVLYTQDPDRVAALEDEAVAMTALGLRAVLTDTVALPFPVECALRTPDQLHIHAGRYAAGLADALVEAGGRIWEDTRALDVDERTDHVVVETDRGVLRADQVVLATLLPFLDRGGFFAKVRPLRSYGVAARLDEEPPEGMFLGVDETMRSLVPWSAPDGPGLVVVGEGHPTGHRDATPRRWGDLEEWTRERFDVATMAYRWSAQDYRTIDRIPYVGRSPRTSRTLVATGFGRWGLSNGAAAARMLADTVAGRDNPHAFAFDATRIGDPQAIGRLVQANAHVAVRFVADRLARLAAPAADHVGPGEGGVVDLDGQAVGLYREPSGRVHAVGLTCTHLGCSLQWNAAETSWDCPCHGSRFGVDGAVLAAPAVRPLPVVEVDEPVEGGLAGRRKG